MEEDRRQGNGRQNEQDLQDGFGLRRAGAISIQLNPAASSLLSILFIMSKKSG
jgi:hypothetical protein